MISIIVPVYKSEKTLERCVKSLLAQEYQDLEVILVDDGSPDGCPALCDKLAEEDPRVRVIHKENGGVSSARNAGLTAALGTYVMFVDSDDYVELDYCAKMQKALENASGKLAICGYHHHYLGTDVEKCPKTAEKNKLLDLYGSGYLNMPWNKIFLREQMGRFPEDLSLGEDLLFNLDYMSRTIKREDQIALVELPLCHYIQEDNGSSLSSQKRKNKLELAKRIRKEAKSFLEKFYGKDQDGIREVTDTRFLCECLDEIERLPFDKGMTSKEKRQIIRGLVEDMDVQEACESARPPALDYRILTWCLRRKLVSVTYVLSWFRSLAVRLKHGLG